MAAPVLGNRNAFYVNYVGTDDAGYNAIGAPWSYRTLPAALAALALVANPPSATNPWIISIGPGVFDVPAGFQLPPWVWITGSPDGEAGSATILSLTGNITLSTAWAVNTTARGGLANLVIRPAAGSPVIDFTMPVPSAGNPVRTLDVINVRHDIDFTFEATSTADGLQIDSMTQDGTLADTITILAGTVALNQLRTVADVVLQSKAAIALVAAITSSQIPVVAVTKAAAACTVGFDAVSWPLRANVTLTGGPTLTRLSDANAVAFSPLVPGNWPVVPTTVQEGLDDIQAGGPASQISRAHITYTGTFAEPFVMSVVPAAILAPVAAGTGLSTEFVSTPGLYINQTNYTENLSSFGNRLLTLSFDDLVGCGSIAINGCAVLTSLSFPQLVYAINNFNSTNNPLGTTFSIPQLKWVFGAFNPGTWNSLINFSGPELLSSGGFGPATFPLCTTFSFPKYQFCEGGFTPGIFAVLTTLRFDALTGVATNFAPSTFALCTTWSFAVLANIGGTFAPTTFAALVTLACDALQKVDGAFSIAAMASLTTISFAAMITYGSTITINTGLGNLTVMTLGTIGTLKAITGATINVSGQKLNAASVNAILALLVSLDGTNGTTLWGAGKTLNISGGTSAAPSGQGIVDKATLIARTATVTTN